MTFPVVPLKVYLPPLYQVGAVLVSIGVAHRFQLLADYKMYIMAIMPFAMASTHPSPFYHEPLTHTLSSLAVLRPCAPRARTYAENMVVLTVS